MDPTNPVPNPKPPGHGRGRRRRGRRGGHRGRNHGGAPGHPQSPQTNGAPHPNGTQANGAVVEGAGGAPADLQQGQPQPQQHQQQQQMTTLAQRCQRQFPNRARNLGRDYFVGGRVSEPAREGDAYTLNVLGSGPSYKVTLDFSKTPGTKSLDARCDCPYYDGGGLCKHLWAAILQIDKAGLASTIPEAGALRVLHAKPRSRQEKRQQGSPGGQPNVVPVLPMPLAKTTDWLTRVEQIQNPGAGKSLTAFAGTSVAFFVVNAAETVSTGKLILDLWIRDRLPNGGLGPLKPNQILTHFARFTDPRDQDVLSVLSKTCTPQTFHPFGRGPGSSACSRFTVDPILETHLVPTLASAGKLFLSRAPNGTPDDADRPLKIDRNKPWDLELRVEASQSPAHLRLGGMLRRDTENRAITEPVFVFASGFMLFSDRISRLTDVRQVAWLNALRAPEPFYVPREQGDALMKKLLTDPSVTKVAWPDDLGWTRSVIEPTPQGIFRPLGNAQLTGRMMLMVTFDYSGKNVSLDDQNESLIDFDQKKIYVRNLPFEEKTLTQALQVLHDDQGTGTFPLDELSRVATELAGLGWNVFMDSQRLHVATDFAMNVSSGTDWFDLTMKADFANGAATQPALLAALEAKQGFVKLEDGSLGLLPDEWVSRYASLSPFAEKNDDGSLRFNKSQGLMLNSALAEDEWLKGDKGFTAFQERVRKFEGVKAAKAPKGFNGKLRNYQKEGLAWLDFVAEFEMGGILADDMGLGKTIQILAFLLSRKSKDSSPSLVIAPKSLVFNWRDEAEKFAPDLKVISYAGASRSKELKKFKSADLIVTTYGTVRTDIEKLLEYEFDVALVDEAQAIKNPDSQSAVACKRVRAAKRLALTGTPIENSLTDLFSILEFTSPGLLKGMSKQKDLNDETRQILSSMLRPFVLRRTKEKVLTELPEKSEQVLYCEMSAEERELYNQLRDHYRAVLTGEIDKGGIGKAKLHVLEALLRLRQASCHPGLVNPDKKGEPSAKLKVLLNQLQEVIAEGHKALVFSQFTSLLALVRDSFDKAGIVYEYLDGQTVDRKTPVERFQTDPKCPAFLISLKAGGVGLNLTAADYVFILDPWWNPAVEAQAIGRAHRLGQSNKVFAYRMIASGTVEEKILDLQKSKRELAESLFSEDQDFIRKLTKEDLELLLT